MKIIAICANQECNVYCVAPPIPSTCGTCQSKIIQTCENPACNELIENIVTDDSHLPDVCPLCSEPLRYPPDWLAHRYAAKTASHGHP
jgi:hypothetical protein